MHGRDSNEHFPHMTPNKEKDVSWWSPKRHLTVPLDQSGGQICAFGDQDLWWERLGRREVNTLRIPHLGCFVSTLWPTTVIRNEVLFINFLCISANLLDCYDYSESSRTHSLISHLSAPWKTPKKETSLFHPDLTLFTRKFGYYNILLVLAVNPKVDSPVSRTWCLECLHFQPKTWVQVLTPPPNLLSYLQLGTMLAETLLVCKNGDDIYPMDFPNGKCWWRERVISPESHINEAP